MRKPAVCAFAFFASCFVQPSGLWAETFSLTTSGVNLSTGVTTTVVLSLAGTPDAVAGAYDINSGSGTITMVNGANTTTQNLALFAGGTATTYQEATFGPPTYTYNSLFDFDNVVYPAGTQRNGANGDVLDEYGLLFTATGYGIDNNIYNFFGTGGYAFTDDAILQGFDSPLGAVTLVDTTGAAVTPEPSSFALLATGLLGTAGVIRRRFQV